ncbi:MAG: M20/M25/M40 family metallo-hydrolase [Planctomycetaceae bacterium]|nr:M20/M25/M40 family metallo-hydrolase [Planctomycetaceae bacterium]
MPIRFKKLLLIALSGFLLPLALRAQEPPPSKPASNEATKPATEEPAKAEAKAEPAKALTDPIDRIKDEGLNRSQLMTTLSYLTDVIGPRLTGSPNLKRASEWTCQTLTRWGLANAHLEAWGPFGKGWTLKRFSAQVIEPQCIPLIAFPKAWSPSTDGALAAQVVYFDAKSEADFAKFKGTVRGTIVLTGPPREVSAGFEPLAKRRTDKELLDLANAGEPSPSRFGMEGQPGNRNPSQNPDQGGPRDRAPGSGPASAQPSSRRNRFGPEMRAQMELARKKSKFLADEGAALLVDCSAQGDGGTLFVAGASVPGAAFPMPGQAPTARPVSAWDKDAPRIPPQIVVAKEHYNRLVRMIEQGEKLKMVVDIAAQFHDDDLMAYNTIAEIPGSDLKDEVVMLGGHLDSWHSGTGATDNAAGVSVAMEAVRILKALDLKPRRTIRICLWSGEEQDLLGSRAYVAQHFGKAYDPMAAMMDTPEASSEKKESSNGKSASSDPKAEYAKFSAYFNLDNGTGKIRGVYMQGNEAVRPIFREWLQPFREMGASTLTLNNTHGTDHQSFDGVGLPGFQFIQDEIHYSTRTHHSNQDVFDQIQADDMKQAAVIMASFVYNTAMRDEKLPRKPESRGSR